MRNVDIKVYVGSRIRSVRQSLKISGEELGSRVGLSQQQISRYESGQSMMTIGVLFLISEALNVPVSRLIPANYHESDNSD
ncbi:helix-turn-helix domain-containing protein [Morganella morganii]|uniref:helix-turn-helix domain-containing protein n=1 Tax=Morganella morganii TaxID=582 RepID=UPI001BDB5119|nr:helix-turn-helix transcriptional regulator [Morganella morganii subsp. morganii]